MEHHFEYPIVTEIKPVRLMPEADDFGSPNAVERTDIQEYSQDSTEIDEKYTEDTWTTRELIGGVDVD